MQESDILQTIVQAVRKHIPDGHYKLFLFGSRAEGTATPRSDYDIGIEAEKELPGGVSVKIMWDLEDIPVLQKIDFVDFKTVSERFSQFAKKATTILYEQ